MFSLASTVCVFNINVLPVFKNWELSYANLYAYIFIFHFLKALVTLWPGTDKRLTSSNGTRALMTCLWAFAVATLVSWVSESELTLGRHPTGSHCILNKPRCTPWPKSPCVLWSLAPFLTHFLPLHILLTRLRPCCPSNKPTLSSLRLWLFPVPINSPPDSYMVQFRTLYLWFNSNITSQRAFSGPSYLK